MNQEVPTTLVASLDAAHCKAIKAEHKGYVLTEDTYNKIDCIGMVSSLLNVYHRGLMWELLATIS